MKAIRVHGYGGPEVLSFDDAPRPACGDGEVLVRVAAAGVNPIDYKLRSGDLAAHIPLALPWIPGVDFSGTVEEVGPGVVDLRAGDEVFGKTDLPRNGSYAQYVAVPRAAVAAKPLAIDHAQAAAVPLAALTAWQALFGGAGAPSLELQPDETVLVLGAAGGVGSFAVQLAQHHGAHVIGLARAGQEPHLRDLGVDRIVFDLASAGWVDAILDLVGGELAARAWGQLKRGGAFASTLGAPSAEEAAARDARAIGVTTRTDGAQLAHIATLIDAGSVEVVVSEIMPLASAREAHERLAGGGVRGKLALTA